LETDDRREGEYGASTGFVEPTISTKVGTLQRLIGLIVTVLFLFGAGVGVGGVAEHKFYQVKDPLRQDSPYMEAWLQANVQADFHKMYQISSPWLQKDLTEAQFIEAYSHAKTSTAPKITFVASILMPTGVREDFYLIQDPTDPKYEDGIMIPFIVDENGKFLMYPQG
jgi:hypothetical protein